MRSRPDLSISLTPRTPSPGGTLQVDLLLTSEHETPVDAIEIELRGAERNETLGIVRPLIAQRHVIEAHTLAPGEHAHQVSFDLPADLLPSHRTETSSVRYELSVRVDIPWWPDRTSRREVEVRPPDAPYDESPRVCSTSDVGGSGQAPALELSLASDRVHPGGELRGAVAFFNLGSRKVRRVEVELTTFERPASPEGAMPCRAGALSLTIPEAPEPGAPLPFRLPLPADHPADGQTPLVEVFHGLTVRGVTPLGSDVTLDLPIRVAHGHVRAAAAQPLVGEQRQRLLVDSMRAELEREGCEVSETEQGQISLRFGAGSRQVKIWEEQYKSGDRNLMAAVCGLPLGMWLRFNRRSGGEALEPKGDGQERGFQQEFCIQCREQHQAERLFTPELQQALMRFEIVVGDDSEVTITRPRTRHDSHEIYFFYTQVKSLAEALSMAALQVPPPAALAPLLAAYEAFAAEQGAYLRRGDLSLNSWRMEGIWLGVDHTFEGATPRLSCLHAWVTPPEDTEPWRKAITRALDRQPMFAADRVIIPATSSPAQRPVCLDPWELVPLAERFVALLASLTGRARPSSPYR